MIIPAFHINAEEAEKIMDRPHDTYTGVAHRWHTDRYYVFESAGKLFEFLYMEPATEMQDGQDVWEADPIPCYEVREGYRLVIEYRRIRIQPEDTDGLPENLPPPNPGYRWFKNDFGSWNQIPDECDPATGYHSMPHRGCVLR